MALHHLDITMTTAAKQVSATRVSVKQITIFNLTGNAAILVGGPTVSATSYGYSIAAAASLTIGPLSGELSFSLHELWLLGTNAQVAHILYLT